MDLVGTVALLGFLLLLAAASSPPLFAAWTRAMGSRRELQLWQVMRRRGLVADDARPAEMARAIRRCAMCPSVDACSAWLASGRSEGTDEFCPNERFFGTLQVAKER